MCGIFFLQSMQGDHKKKSDQWFILSGYFALTVFVKEVVMFVGHSICTPPYCSVVT